MSIMPISPSIDPMQQMGQSSNILSGLIGMPEKMIKGVMKTVSDTVGDTLSQHAVDAVNHGVPWGHIIGELLKSAPGGMNPADLGKSAGMALMGGGSPPPGGPNPGGGGPPPGGQPAVKNDNSPQLNPGQLQNSPYQQGQPGFAPQNINQALTGQPMQQNQMLMPQIMPAKGIMEGASTDQNGNVYQQGMGMQVLHSLMPSLFPGGMSTADAVASQTAMGKTPQGQLSMDMYKAKNIPLAKAEEQKQQLENFYGLQKALIEKGATGLKPAEAAKFSSLQSGQSALEDVNSLLFNNNGKDFASNMAGLRTPLGPLQPQRARQIQSALTRAVIAENDAQGNPRQSDSAVEDQVKALMVKFGSSPQTVAKALLAKHQMFTNGLNIADPNGIYRQQAAGQGGKYLNQVLGMKPPTFQGSQANYVKTGMYNGKRVGMTQDGRIEEMQ